MDDLLVIIFTLIVAVIGALGQINKKKKPVSTGNQPAENGSDNFWGMVEEQFYDEQPEQEQQQETEKIDKPEETEERMPVYKFKAENEGTPVTRPDRTKEIKKEKKPKANKKLKEFSLRKAVIYSEILNQKYQ